MMTLTQTTSPRRLTTAETAAALRSTLKTAFPGTKFSVTSKTYSGGSSINVRWTDGASFVAVHAVADRFAGATFDGMTDMKSYKRPMVLAGEAVLMGADYVFCDRSTSADLLRKVVNIVTSRVNYGHTAEAMTAWIAAGGRGAWFDIPATVERFIGAKLSEVVCGYDATLNLVVKAVR